LSMPVHDGRQQQIERDATDRQRQYRAGLRTQASACSHDSPPAIMDAQEPGPACLIEGLDRPVSLVNNFDMINEKTDSKARRRIMDTARNLFYRNGYRATGINEIIKKSGVAKATFYAHFPAKESLALAYVKSINQEEIRILVEGIQKFAGPYERLIGLLEFLIPWSHERDYRGCAYLNMSSEIPNHANPVRQESKDHYLAVRRLIGRLMQELKVKRGAAWKGRDAEKVADDFMLVFSGAMAMAQVYHDAEPFREAIDAAKRLLR
jgi:AcrR family transcriptional regulator